MGGPSSGVGGFGPAGMMERRGLGSVKRAPQVSSTDSDITLDTFRSEIAAMAVNPANDFGGFGGGSTGGAGAGGSF